MCSVDVVMSQLQWFYLLFNKLTDIMIETSTLQRTIEELVMNLTLLLRFVVSYTQPRSNIFTCRIHRLVCVHQNQIQRFHARISALLHSNNLVDTFGMYPISLFTPRSKHKIFGQIPTVDIVPEICSFQDLILLEKDFWYWSCNLLNCIQLIILFELLSKCLQNRRHRIWKIRVQQRGLQSRFIQFLSQTSRARFSKKLSKVILTSTCLWRNPVVFRAYSLDFDRVFWTWHLNESSFTKWAVDFFCEFLHRGLSQRCMSSWMFM